MFEYSLAHWLAFFTAAVLLNLSPGPDMAFILGQTIRGGKRTGFLAMFGIWTGAFIHVVLAAAGLSAILAASAIAFGIVKWLGVIYLVWLGIQALRSNDTFSINNFDSPLANGLSVFKQGVFVATLNPKVAVFFLAFLPQFVVVGAGSPSMQLFLHGILIIAVAGLVEPPLIFAGSKLTNMLKKNTRIGVWLDKALGSLFIALGIRLALSERS
jgi:threonine/homoserine/homoserine lactone efflux protein